MFWLLYFFRFRCCSLTVSSLLLLLCFIGCICLTSNVHSHCGFWVCSANSNHQCNEFWLCLFVSLYCLFSSQFGTIQAFQKTERKPKDQHNNNNTRTKGKSNEYSGDNTYSFIFLVVAFRTHLFCVLRHTKYFEDRMLSSWIAASIKLAVRCILHVLHERKRACCMENGLFRFVHHFVCVPLNFRRIWINNIFYTSIESANCDQMLKNQPTVCDRYIVFSEMTRWDKVTEPTK